MSKTALVTGGSRGIGKCVVDLLRARGWNVIAPTRDSMDLTRYYRDFWYPTFARREGDTLDALVHCAGLWYSRPGFHPESAWMAQYALSVMGFYQVVERHIEKIKQSKGVVVAVASTRGFIGGVETAPYSCAKAAQIALIQGYAREYPDIRFNCVAPGLTDTDMGQDVIKTGGAKPGAAMQPPEVVAAEIVRLLESDDNGRVMRVVNSEISEARWTW